MIVGLTRNMSYILHSFHKQNLNGDWLEGAILYNIKTLQEYDSMLKGFVYDN